MHKSKKKLRARRAEGWVRFLWRGSALAPIWMRCWHSPTWSCSACCRDRRGDIFIKALHIFHCVVIIHVFTFKETRQIFSQNAPKWSQNLPLPPALAGRRPGHSLPPLPFLSIPVHPAGTPPPIKVRARLGVHSRIPKREVNSAKKDKVNE